MGRCVAIRPPHEVTRVANEYRRMKASSSAGSSFRCWGGVYMAPCSDTQPTTEQIHFQPAPPATAVTCGSPPIVPVAVPAWPLSPPQEQVGVIEFMHANSPAYKRLNPPVEQLNRHRRLRRQPPLQFLQPLLLRQLLNVRVVRQEPQAIRAPPVRVDRHEVLIALKRGPVAHHHPPIVDATGTPP